jgi:hypothetical protein
MATVQARRMSIVCTRAFQDGISFREDQDPEFMAGYCHTGRRVSRF